MNICGIEPIILHIQLSFATTLHITDYGTSIFAETCDEVISIAMQILFLMHLNSLFWTFNTGFGIVAKNRIPSACFTALQRSLLPLSCLALEYKYHFSMPYKFSMDLKYCSQVLESFKHDLAHCFSYFKKLVSS